MTSWMQAQDSNCSICMSPLILDGDGRQWLDCGHCFHESCIQDFRRFGAQAACPTCRNPDESLRSVDKMTDEAVQFFRFYSTAPSHPV